MVWRRAQQCGQRRQLCVNKTHRELSWLFQLLRLKPARPYKQKSTKLFAPRRPSLSTVWAFGTTTLSKPRMKKFGSYCIAPIQIGAAPRERLKRFQKIMRCCRCVKGRYKTLQSVPPTSCPIMLNNYLEWKKI